MSINSDIDNVEELKEQINKLKQEVEKKDSEIMNYLDKIENLEDEIMELRSLLPDETSKKKSKKVVESKLRLELEAKDREIRELKDRMGYLRKEKIELQKELEKLKKGSSSRVIRVEDLRKQPPLHILVKELQDKINKQESLLRKLENNKLEIEENYKKI